MYIWENYTPLKKFYVGKKISPYMEVLNNTENIVEVNPLLRFEGIFSELEKAVETQNLENILFHYLVMLDTIKGLDKKQIFLNRLEEEIQAGDWGEFVQEKWSAIQSHHKEIILCTLYERKDNSKAFLDIIKKLFHVTSLLYEKSTETYYLYLNDSMSKEYCQTLIEVVKFLFWDIQNHIEIVWKNYYGIIGSDETMKISKIQLV